MSTATAAQKDLSQFARIPADLIQLDQWVCWRFEERKEKRTKVPYNARNGRMAASDNPRTWASYAESLEAFSDPENNYDGIGFVFTGPDPFCGIDLDKSLTESGELLPWALAIYERVAPCYSEVSPSGTGIKIYTRAVLDGRGTKRGGFGDDGKGAVEVYDRGRFFTVTGRTFNGSTKVEERGEQVLDLYHELTAPKIKPEKATAKPCPADADDNAIIDKVIADVKYAMLWSGGHDGYPSDSEADLALMGRVGFFVGWDPRRMESVFGQSPRAGEKWNSRADYRLWTIDKARAGKTGSYNWNGKGQPKKTPANAASAPVMPIPLDSAIPPELPDGIFRGWLAETIYAVAESKEAPPELAVNFALTVLATVAQKIFSHRVRHDYFEPLNIWMLTALAPGNRKTGVMIDLIEPLAVLERRWAAEYGPRIEAAASERKSVEARISHLRDVAKKATPEAFKKQMEEIAEMEASLPEIPTTPMLWLQDVTPEHLGTVLAANGERGSIFSDEGGILETIGGRYSNGVPNMDLFLQSHAGGPVKQSRGNRSPVNLSHPALTFALSPQPDVLQSMSTKKEFRGRGFCARFLFMVPTSRLGFRTGAVAPIPDGVMNRYQLAIESIANVQPQQLADGRQTPHTLYSSPEALTRWEAFWQEVEVMMRDGGRLANLTDWGGKLPGAVARIAALLHIADYASDPLACKEIDAGTMGRAITFGRFLIDHAIIAFGMMGADVDLEAARFIWKAVEQRKRSEWTARELWKLVRGRYPRMDEVDGAFDALINHGHLVEPHQADDMPRKKGRPPSRKFIVNPLLSEGWQ